MPDSQTPKIVSDIPSLPPRAPEMHKGQAGHVAIVAGSRGMSGAACLSGLGALRAGAGLVRIYAPASVQPIVAASEPSLMTVPLPEDEAGRFVGDTALAQLRAAGDWPTALAIGPGLGASAATGAFVLAVLDWFAGPLVLDADALNSLALTDRNRPWWQVRRERPLVITPHPGEMARLRKHAGLTPRDDQDGPTRLAVAVEFAELTGAVVVLKGHASVVATRGSAFVNTTGNAGMATGGMGDVLTGIVAALLAQGLPPFDAARLAVHAHGAAADRLVKHIGPFGYLAREVADMLPSVLETAGRRPIGFK